MSDSQGQDGGGERLVLRWVFVRGEERIDLCRSADPTSTQVDVSDGGVMRAFRFANRAAVVAFHAGFEQALTQTGWKLMVFEPERRRGDDRRVMPRAGDRRGSSLALVWSRN